MEPQPSTSRVASQSSRTLPSSPDKGCTSVSPSEGVVPNVDWRRSNIIQEFASSETYNRRFGINGTKSTFKFNLPPAGVSEFEWIQQGFSNIVDNVKRASLPTDYIGFTLKSTSFNNKEPGYLSFRKATEVHPHILWDIFGGMIQSNSGSITSSDTFEIESTRVRLPGFGRQTKSLNETNGEESNKKHHSLRTMEGPARKSRRRCTVCYKNNRATLTAREADKQTKLVKTYCAQCNGCPFMCSECFNNKHM